MILSKKITAEGISTIRNTSQLNFVDAFLGLLVQILYLKYWIVFFFRPLHTALINLKYEVFQNILDVMATLPDSYSRINAYNFHHQVSSEWLLHPLDSTQICFYEYTKVLSLLQVLMRLLEF